TGCVMQPPNLLKKQDTTGVQCGDVRVTRSHNKPPRNRRRIDKTQQFATQPLRTSEPSAVKIIPAQGRKTHRDGGMKRADPVAKSSRASCYKKANDIMRQQPIIFLPGSFMTPAVKKVLAVVLRMTLICVIFHAA
ncbi:MAG: hypothetical protein ACP5O1_12295, partial [Phycisphaerae bacterium]